MKAAATAALALLSLPALSQRPQPTPVRYELRGVVSYFLNDSQGYKPDVGAKAYVIKAGAMPSDSLDAGAAEAYRKANTIYSLGGGGSKSLLPGEQSPREAYLSARERLFALERRLARSKAAVGLTADGQGVFSKKLTPGTYWIFIKSAGRSGAQMQKATITNDSVEVSAKFEAD